MKKIFLIIITALLIAPCVYAQQILTIYPDKNAQLRYGESSPYNSYQNTNYGGLTSFLSYQWTYSGIPIKIKSLMGIDLAELPELAYIVDAKLYLYAIGDHKSNAINGGSYKSNASYISRIITEWDENIVTWNTPPTSVTDNQATLLESTSTDQNYVVNVTELIRDIQQNPTASDGLMLSLINEQAYTRMNFATSDHTTTSLHPKLEITYTSNFYDQAGFEFTETKWGNVDGDDIEWTKKTGGTPSSSTGPSSASEGSNYIYVEASSPNYPSKTAILHSPLYSFKNLDNPFIGFDYHMYGSAMGSLSLEVSTDNGVTWQSPVWSKSGDQGNAWYNANVDLSDYIDENVILRFRGVTGSSYTSDMAIDNITVYATIVPKPSQSENYIHNTFPKSENGIDGYAIQEIQYFDGLGRLNQRVSVASSPSGYDIVEPYEYDDYGRIPRAYQPYPVSDNVLGEFRANASTDSEAYFAELYGTPPTEAYSYSTTVFEESPLNRVLKQGAPGEAFSPIDETDNATEHVQHLEYGTNIGSEVCYFSVNMSDGALLNSPSHYAANELQKISIEDENGNTTEEFKDKLGRVILKRAFNGPDTYSTYYVYDDFGLIRWVLPPKAEADNGVPTTDILGQVCYSYKYDEKKRMVEKKLPDVEPIYMVYDDRGRLVCIQDGVMKGKNEWLYTKYDVLNRPVKTGVIETTTALTQATMQTNIDDFYDLPSSEIFEERTSTGIGYTNQSFPSTGSYIQSDQALSITYYDDYSHYSLVDFPDQSPNAVDNIDNYIDPQGSNLTYFDRVKGQVTGSSVLVLNGVGDKWIHSTIYYDDRYRVIQLKSTLFPEGSTMISNRYDFNNILLESLEIQNVNSIDHKIRYMYKYDHANRPVDTYIYLNDDEPVLLSSLNYNELGQLREKNLHLDDQTGFVQSVDYSYSMRGWLTGMNDPLDLAQDNDLFGMNLYYDETIPNISHPVNYNGNISGIIWKHSDYYFTESFNYAYDSLSRIKSSDFRTFNLTQYDWLNGSSYETNISYDKNGNIENLQRRGSSAGFIDDLTYDYTTKGNQLNHVTDASPFTTSGFIDGNTSGADFIYDDNGNLITDKNKGIDISYNYINLPNKITENLGSAEYIDYIYDVSGTKWMKEYDNNGSPIKTMYAGGFVYVNSDPNGSNEFDIEYILNPEGRINMKGSIDYQYNITDHLGNIRAVFNESGTVLQNTDYYIFGTTFLHTDNGSDNKYLFNGKELQDEQLGGVNLDWYDYGARYYDPALGRFHTIDPLAESYVNLTPYNYVGGNPINIIDPDGMDWYDIDGAVTWKDQEGDYVDGDNTYQSLGKNVVVVTHNRNEGGETEEINTATFSLYLEGNTEGVTATIKGNTVPDDPEASGTLKEGIYPAKAQSRSKYAKKGKTDMAIIINGGNELPTVNGNPSKSNSDNLTGVFIHMGNNYQSSLHDSKGNAYSRGCLTGGNYKGSHSDYNAWRAKSPSFKGNVYLRAQPSKVSTATPRNNTSTRPSFIQRIGFKIMIKALNM